MYGLDKNMSPYISWLYYINGALGFGWPPTGIDSLSCKTIRYRLVFRWVQNHASIHPHTLKI